jgi:TolB-like protein
MSLVTELKRRKVVRVAIVYAATAFAVLQAADIMLPRMGIPDWGMSLVVALAVLGFPIALVLAWALELTPDGIRRTESVTPGQVNAAPPLLGKRTVFAAALLVAVGAGLGAGWFLRPASESEAVPAPPAAEAPAPSSTGADQSIAVLAFADLSPGRDQEYFSDGIAEEILNALAKVPGLRVAGRTSAFHFKGRSEDLRGIGKALGVAHILEGSVRKQGERVRITAQLIRSEDGFHLWSETYDGDLSDVFALQERIARSITSQFRLVLSGSQSQRLVNSGTANTDAYSLFLQATSTFNRRDGARYAEAQAQLEQAIGLDPQYARAHARLAALHVLAGDIRSLDLAQVLADVKHHAGRASELDPGLAEPYAALGMAFGNLRRFREQREAFERALQLDQNDVTTHFWHGVSLINTGYRRAGNAALDRALALDPLLPNALMWRAYGYIADGDLESAERLLRHAADGGLVFVGLGQSALALARGQRNAAIEPLARGLKYFSQKFPPDAPEWFARACLGDREAKARSLALIDAHLATDPTVIPAIVPYVLIRSGEVARGFALMQDRPTTNDSLNFGELLGSRMTGALRAPEYPEFARRTGLAELWDAYGPPDQCRKAANGDYQCD